MPVQRAASQNRPSTVSVVRIVVAKEGGQTAQYEIAKDLVHFGRSPDCEVRLEAKNISRVHCMLESRADGLWVRDNDSLNGIFVNGEKVKEAILTARDAVKVGPYRFKAIVSGTIPRPATERPAVAPSRAPEMDKTLPAFQKPEPEPAPRPPSSAAVALEALAKSPAGEDRTPVDGTPVAARADALRPSPSRADIDVTGDQTPAAAALAAKAAPIAPVTRAPAAPAPRTRPAPAPVPPAEPVRPEPREVKAERPVSPAIAPRGTGRFSLTTPPAKKGGPARAQHAREGSVQKGELCGSCFEGHMLTWQGELRCRKCDHRAPLAGAPAAKPVAAPMATPVAQIRTQVSSVRPEGVADEPALGKAVLTGAGLFVAFYGTVIVCSIAQAFLAPMLMRF